jgi:tetratricopeptide (TPR) repeat protein
MMLQDLIVSVLGNAAWDLFKHSWGQAEQPQQVYDCALAAAKTQFHARYGNTYGKEHDAFFDFAKVDEALFRACLCADALEIEQLVVLATEVKRPTPREAIEAFVGWLRAELQRTPYFALLFQGKEQVARLSRVAGSVEQVKVDIAALKSTPEQVTAVHQELKALRADLSAAFGPPQQTSLTQTSTIADLTLGLPSQLPRMPGLSSPLIERVYVRGLEGEVAVLDAAVRQSAEAVIDAGESLRRSGRITDAATMLSKAAAKSGLPPAARYELLCAAVNAHLTEPFDASSVQTADSLLSEVEKEFPAGKRNNALRALLCLAKGDLAGVRSAVQVLTPDSDYYRDGVIYATAAIAAQGQLAEAARFIEQIPNAKRDAKFLNVRAQLRAAQGDSSGALADINEAIRMEPNAPHYYFVRGKLAGGHTIEMARGGAVLEPTQRSTVEAAYEDFKKSVSLFEERQDSRGSADAYSLLAITTTLLRGPHEAVKVYRRAADRGVRLDSRGRANRAVTMAAAGEFQEAIDDFRAARAGLEERDVSDNFDKTLCATLVMAGEYDEARTLFAAHTEWDSESAMVCLKVVVQYPNDPRKQIEALEGLGEAMRETAAVQASLHALYLDTNDLERAEATLRKAADVESEPRLREWFQVRLAHFLDVKRGKLDEALAIYESHYFSKQHRDFLRRYLAALLRARRLRRLAEIEDEVLADNFDDPLILDALGVYNLNLKNYPQAKKLYAQLCEIEPKSPGSRARLAICLDAEGDTESAIAQLHRAISANPADASLCAALHHDLASILFRTQRYREALAAEYTALEKNPQEPAYYLHYFGYFVARQEELDPVKDSDFIRRFQEVGEEYLQRFPQEEGLQRLTGTPEELARAMEEVLQRSAESGQAALGAYSSTPMPIHAFARILGRTEYESWQSLVGSENRFRYWGAESVQEQLAAFEKANKVALHSSALFFFAATNTLANLARSGKQLVYAQALYEDLQQTLGRLLLRRKAKGVVAAVEGRLHFTEVPADAWTYHIEVIQRLAGFLITSCTPLPNSVEMADMPVDSLEFLGEETGCLFTTTKGISAVLLCDDSVVRMLGKHDFGVDVCTTSALLASLMNAGAIQDSDAYNSALDLLRFNYNLVPMSPAFARWAGVTSPSRDVDLVARHLVEQIQIGVPVGRCITQLLCGLAERAGEQETRAALLKAVLQRVQKLPDQQLVATVLVLALHELMPSPRARLEFLDILRGSERLPADTLGLSARIVRELAIAVAKGQLAVAPDEFRHFISSLASSEIAAILGTGVI